MRLYATIGELKTAISEAWEEENQEENTCPECERLLTESESEFRMCFMCSSADYWQP